MRLPTKSLFSDKLPVNGEKEYLEGIEYIQLNKYVLAREILQKSAEYKYPAALLWLSRLYEDFDIYDAKISQSYKLQVKSNRSWFEKLITQSHDHPLYQADAQNNLGFGYVHHYFSGVYNPTINHQAVQYFKAAARQNYADAHFQLGFCYQYGVGIAKDMPQAILSYLQAANQGHILAQTYLARCYQEQHSETSIQEAVRWFRAAADNKQISAQFRLACCYKEGVGVEQDHAQAFHWFDSAAQQNHILAQAYLSYCYASGRGVEKNLLKSDEWFAKAKAHEDKHKPEILMLYARDKNQDARMSLLYAAAAQGFNDLLEFLLEHKAELNQLSFNDENALHAAAINNRQHTVEYLLDKKMDVNHTTGASKKTVLHKICEYSVTPMIKFLVEKNADLNMPAHRAEPILHQQIMHNKINIAKYLLKNKADVNQKNASGYSILHSACVYGNNKIKVKFLLDNKVDLLSENNNGETALYLAILNKQTDIVQLLSEAKMDIHAINTRGRTLLHLAASAGHLETVKWLLQNQVSINAVDIQGQSPLMLAAMNLRDTATVLKALVEHKAAINLKDQMERTALQLAIRQNCLENAKTLIELKADWIEEDNNKLLLAAAYKGSVSLIELLLENKVDVNYRGLLGETALHKAAESGLLNSVKILLDQKAEVNLRDKRDAGAVHYAEKFKKQEVINLLMEKKADIDPSPSGMEASARLTIDDVFYFQYLSHIQNANYELARELFKRLALRQHPASLLLLARLYKDYDIFEDKISSEYINAIRNRRQWFENLVQALSTHSDPLYLADAQNNLAYCYIFHHFYGQSEPHTKSLAYFSAAAAQGHTDALFNLGYCHQNGLGVKKDYKKAFEYYRLAAYKNHPLAQVHLADCYRKEIGEEKSEHESARWYRIAAEQGQLTAQYRLGDCYHRGMGVAQSYNNAFRWFYSVAAQQNHILAQAYVSLYYARGHGVQANLLEAARWLNKAQSQQTKNSNGGSLKSYHFADRDQDINVPLLMAAAAKAGVDLIEYLLEQKADINQTVYSDSILHAACIYERVDNMRYLLDKKIDINKKFAFDNTVLHTACQEGKLNMVKFLVENKAEINPRKAMTTPAIYTTISLKYMDIAEYLIENKADVNCYAHFHDTILHHACVRGETDTVQFLLAKKANLNLESGSSSSTAQLPLHMALNNGQMHIVKIFTELKMDIHTPNSKNQSSLYIAAASNKNHTVEFLLQNKALVNGAETTESPLMAAASCYEDSALVISTLMQNKADINLRNQYKQTPLLIAANKPNLKNVKTLVEWGAQFGAEEIEKIQSEQTKNYLQTLAKREGVTDAVGMLNKQGYLTLNLHVKHEDIIFDKELGKGEYSVVRAGKLNQFNPVVIKTFIGAYASDQKNLAEYRREASIMTNASLFSDYLVKLHGICIEVDRFNMIMEYMPDGNLYSLLNREKYLSRLTKYQIGFNIAAGLSHLHENKIIHGNLNSLNVLLKLQALYRQGPIYQAKLSDFGLSATRSGKTKMGISLAMAPELLENSDHNFQSDIFSLGIILWELAVHQPTNLQAKAAIIRDMSVDEINQLLETKACQKAFKNTGIKDLTKLVLTEALTSLRLNGLVPKNQAEAIVAYALRWLVIEKYAGLLSDYNEEYIKLIQSCCAFDPELRTNAKQVAQTLNSWIEQELNVDSTLAPVRFIENKQEPDREYVCSELISIGEKSLFDSGLASLKAKEKSPPETKSKKTKPAEPSPLIILLEGEAFYLQGMELIQKHEYLKAHEFFEKSAALQYPAAYEWLYHLSADIGIIECDEDNIYKKIELYRDWFNQIVEGKISAHPLLLLHAQCYIASATVFDNAKRAIELLLMAGNKNYSDAFYRLGWNCRYLLKGASKKSVFDYYYTAAKDGHIGAQYELALCYLRGYGVEKSDSEALHWLQLAVDKGHIRAHYDLAQYYRKQLTLSPQKEFKDIFHLYRFAAEKNHLASQGFVSLYYDQGLGIDKNPSQSLFWLEKVKVDRHDYQFLDRFVQSDCLNLVRFIVEKLDMPKISMKEIFAMAVRHGAIQTAKSLLEEKADVDIQADEAALVDDAINSEVTELIELLLEHKASLNSVDDYGQTRLQSAVHKGKIDAVKFLLEKKADIFQKTHRQKESLLHLATANPAPIEMMRLLLEKIPDIDSQDKSGNTPLQLAIQRDKISTALFLIEQKADIHRGKEEINGTVLHTAAKRGHEDLVRKLLTQKAEIHTENKYEQTPLHFAAEGGHTAVCRLLIENKADIHKQSKQGGTVLGNAVKSGKAELVKILLEMNADMYKRTTESESPFHSSVYQRNLNILKVFLEHKADIHKIFNNGKTILHLAAWIGELEIVRYLLEAKGDIHQSTQSGTTLLEEAVINQTNLSLIKFLLEQKATVRSPEIQESPVLHSAARKGERDIVEYLLDNKIQEVNSLNHYNYTALMSAVSSRDCRSPLVLDTLIERKASVNFRSQKGETALMLAVKTNQLEMLKILIKWHADFADDFKQMPDGECKKYLQSLAKGDEIADTIGTLNRQGYLTLSYQIHHGNIRLENPLGKGAFGMVNAGKLNQFNAVAIKNFPKDYFNDEKNLDAFRREASVMANVSLTSEYLVKLRGICIEPNNQCMIMEYMPDGSLYELLKRESNLPWIIKYKIAFNIAAGLYHLHENNILHCDLKSLNVLIQLTIGPDLKAYYKAKVCDFGLASVKQALIGGQVAGAESKNNFVGTLQWLAPELLRGAGHSRASDVFTLGLVLWELATHQPPYFQIRKTLMLQTSVMEIIQFLQTDASRDFLRSINIPMPNEEAIEKILPALRQPRFEPKTMAEQVIAEVFKLLLLEKLKNRILQVPTEYGIPSEVDEDKGLPVPKSVPAFFVKLIKACCTADPAKRPNALIIAKKLMTKVEKLESQPSPSPLTVPSEIKESKSDNPESMVIPLPQDTLFDSGSLSIAHSLEKEIKSSLAESEFQSGVNSIALNLDLKPEILPTSNNLHENTAALDINKEIAPAVFPVSPEFELQSGLSSIALNLEFKPDSPVTSTAATSGQVHENVITLPAAIKIKPDSPRKFYSLFGASQLQSPTPSKQNKCCSRSCLIL